jgi:hypothetical protein
VAGFDGEVRSQALTRVFWKQNVIAALKRCATQRRGAIQGQSFWQILTQNGG